MEVVGHQDIRDQFAGPPLIERFKFLQKGIAACGISERGKAVEKVFGDIMHGARKVEIRPLASHVRALFLGGGLPRIVLLLQRMSNVFSSGGAAGALPLPDLEVIKVPLATARSLRSHALSFLIASEHLIPGDVENGDAQCTADHTR